METPVHMMASDFGSVCCAIALLPISAGTVVVEARSTGGSNQAPAGDSAMARPPRASDLPGRWVLIRQVMTEKFITGRAGSDRELSDIEGIRRSDLPGRPLE